MTTTLEQSTRPGAGHPLQQQQPATGTHYVHTTEEDGTRRLFLPSFLRESMQMIVAEIQRRDRAMLLKHPHGFKRKAIPGEYYPYTFAKLEGTLVIPHGDLVIRWALGEDGRQAWFPWGYDEWHVDELEYDEQQALFAPLPDEWFGGLADMGAMSAAWEVEDGFIYWLQGEKPMPREITRAWDDVTPIRHLSAAEVLQR